MKTNMPAIQSLGHIIIIDRDDNIAELLAVNLKSEGYSTERLYCASELGREHLDRVSLIIADSMKEDYTGLDLVYDLKEDAGTEHIGIIVYSAWTSERMVIDVLEAGADDYIVKPFSLRELIARVKSVMRRRRRTSAHPAASNIITFQNMTVDLEKQSVKIDGQPLALSKIEYAILTLLLKNMNNYISRLEIHRSVWNDDTAGVNERVVDTNISRLRKKLGEIGTRIVNASGQGYMIS